MADLTRMKHVLKYVEKIWRKYPHWRFGQLLTNVAAWADSPMSCIGEIEDDELVAIIKEHLQYTASRNADVPVITEKTGDSTNGIG